MLCQKHDTLYAEFDSTARNEADKELAWEALRRPNGKYASFGENLSAVEIAGVMTANYEWVYGK